MLGRARVRGWDVFRMTRLLDLCIAACAGAIAAVLLCKAANEVRPMPRPAPAKLWTAKCERLGLGMQMSQSDGGRWRMDGCTTIGERK